MIICIVNSPIFTLRLIHVHVHVLYMYMCTHALSSGKKCLLKDLEFDGIGAKGTVMCEHLRGIHKVGDLICYLHVCTVYVLTLM